MLKVMVNQIGATSALDGYGAQKHDDTRDKQGHAG